MHTHTHRDTDARPLRTRAQVEIALETPELEHHTSALRVCVCRQLRTVQDGEESRKRGSTALNADGNRTSTLE